MLDGAPLRVLRASFSGELSYEVNLPVDRQQDLLERLWSRAADVEGALYGIEALEIMRTETKVAMQQCGVRSVKELNTGFVRRAT